MYPSAQDLSKPTTKDEPIKIKVVAEAHTNNKEKDDKKESIRIVTDNKNVQNHEEDEKLNGNSRLKKVEPDIPDPDYDSDPVSYQNTYGG